VVENLLLKKNFYTTFLAVDRRYFAFLFLVFHAALAENFPFTLHIVLMKDKIEVFKGGLNL
jgi:hypothetical protein